jgi:hypothetical protein
LIFLVIPTKRIMILPQKSEAALKKINGGYPAAATFGLCAVIALVPLPFSSIDTRVIAVWVALLSLVLICASPRAFSDRDLHFLFGFGAIALAWTLVVAEQLFQSQHLAAAIWKQTSAILGEELSSSVSIARNQPYFSVGFQMACMRSMLCGFSCWSQQTRGQIWT